MGKNRQVNRIAASRLTIYDELPVDSDLRIESEELEQILRGALTGIDVAHLPLRSRSKFVKSRVCEAMGYPVPLSFGRTRPRFPGQDLDLYVQQSRNLQVWNEAIQLNRRYAIAILSPKCIINNVHVLSGLDLQKLDKTGKLTSKNQAILRTAEEGRLSVQDTKLLNAQLTKRVGKTLSGLPTDQPNSKSLLSIGEVHRRLKGIEGKVFKYGSATDERIRGFILHEAVCHALGYSTYRDKGTFPDIPAQLLEVKLQTKPTIDLGIVLPDSTEPLEGLELSEKAVSPSDIRYAVFDAAKGDDPIMFRITKVYLVTGADFFKHFSLMKGKGINTKLQIPLPKEYFPWLGKSI
jgi:hypothetical protein